MSEKKTFSCGKGFYSAIFKGEKEFFTFYSDISYTEVELLTEKLNDLIKSTINEIQVKIDKILQPNILNEDLEDDD